MSIDQPSWWMPQGDAYEGGAGFCLCLDNAQIYSPRSLEKLQPYFELEGIPGKAAQARNDPSLL